MATSTTRSPSPVADVSVPEVRQLDMHDVPLLAAYRGRAEGTGFATFDDLLTDGFAAGAVVEGRLVGLAHTNALTARYADIGIATDRVMAPPGLRLRRSVHSREANPGEGSRACVEHG